MYSQGFGGCEFFSKQTTTNTNQSKNVLQLIKLINPISAVPTQNKTKKSFLNDDN
jgi:hypothetical protein